MTIKNPSFLFLSAFPGHLRKKKNKHQNDIHINDIVMIHVLLDAHTLRAFQNAYAMPD